MDFDIRAIISEHWIERENRRVCAQETVQEIYILYVYFDGKARSNAIRKE